MTIFWGKAKETVSQFQYLSLPEVYPLVSASLVSGVCSPPKVHTKGANDQPCLRTVYFSPPLNT